MKKLYTLVLLSSFSCFGQLTFDQALKERLYQLEPKAYTNYFITKDISENNLEQAAVTGFSWGEKWNTKLILGGALRAYGEGNGGVWGADIYGITAPTSNSHITGLEIGVYQRNHSSFSDSHFGINTIFGNRLGSDVPILGENKYNEGTSAWAVDSQPRSPAGEYSGWNKVIRINEHSLDRTRSVPYASVIHFDKQRTDIPIYLVTYPCDLVMCGVKLIKGGIEFWYDINGLPVKIKTL